MKKYRFAFDPGGLLLFFLMMLPNFVWFNLPAPNDILRQESITPVVDGIASVCQILFAAALCAVVNRDRERLRRALCSRVGVLLCRICRSACGGAADASPLPVLPFLCTGQKKRHRGNPYYGLHRLPSDLRYCQFHDLRRISPWT